MAYKWYIRGIGGIQVVYELYTGGVYVVYWWRIGGMQVCIGSISVVYRRYKGGIQVAYAVYAWYISDKRLHVTTGAAILYDHRCGPRRETFITSGLLGLSGCPGLSGLYRWYISGL